MKQSKRSNIITIIVLIFVLIALISSMGINIWLNRTVWNDDYAVGNTSGNLNNGGLFCELEDKIYFSNTKDEGTLYCMDSDATNFKKLSADKAIRINAAGKYLIYSRMNQDKEGITAELFVFNYTGLYRCNLNGKKTKTLYNNQIGAMSLYGNNVYYQHFEKKKGLTFYTVKIDGSDEKKLSNIPYDPSAISDGVMYYSGEDEENGLYAMNLETQSTEKIYDGNTYQPMTYNNDIYFLSLDDNYGIARIDRDGSNKTLLVDKEVSSYNISLDGNYLYYQVDDTKNNGIYRLNLQTKEEKLLKSGNYNNIHTTSNYIFFQEFGTDNVYMATTGEGAMITSFDPPVLKK